MAVIFGAFARDFRCCSRNCRKIATEKFAPYNRKADANEPTFDGERVNMIPEVGEAQRDFNDAGFQSATLPFQMKNRSIDLRLPSLSSTSLPG